jgi:hypothetical protein
MWAPNCNLSIRHVIGGLLEEALRGEFDFQLPCSREKYHDFDEDRWMGSPNYKILFFLF